MPALPREVQVSGIKCYFIYHQHQITCSVIVYIVFHHFGVKYGLVVAVFHQITVSVEIICTQQTLALCTERFVRWAAVVMKEKLT